MIGFWIFMLIMLLLIPLSMLGLGIYFGKNAPKKINYVYGYRTTRSMKNQETWKFAHNYCGKLWKRIGLIMIPITIIAMLFSYGKDIDYVSNYGLVITGIQIIVLFGSIFPVEAALKRNFDKNGNPLK
jgi:uncharacterized membrane protein